MENVKPSQGKQITPYLLNETFLANPLVEIQIQEIIINNPMIA